MNLEDMKDKVRPLWNSKLVYAVRFSIYSAIEKWFGYPILKRQYNKKTGYVLNIKNPKSFNEKICWKKIYDRNPLMAKAADKYEVRNLVKDLLGEDEANNILIPLLYVTDDPETIPFEKFDCEYIIKANHGSGTNIIVSDKNFNRGKIIKDCKCWMRMRYGLFKHEWAYKNIRTKIVVEKLLRDELNNLPIDYKFHMVNGRCEMIQVNQGIFSDETTRFLTLYTPDWQKIDVFWEYPSADAIEKPINLNEMISIAEKLSLPFDYIRVDLYSINKKIFFGELTNYPTTGMAKVVPQSFDYLLGQKWNLKKGYWKGV